jgi:hypothetical protein
VQLVPWHCTAQVPSLSTKEAKRKLLQMQCSKCIGNVVAVLVSNEKLPRLSAV